MSLRFKRNILLLVIGGGIILSFNLAILYFFNDSFSSSSVKIPTPSQDVSSAILQKKVKLGILQNLSLADIQRGLELSPMEIGNKIIKIILSAQKSDFPLLNQYLHRNTGISAEDYKQLLRQINATVPDQAGRFPKNSPDEVENELDWLDALLALRPQSLSSHTRRVLQESILSVALIRAITMTRHTDATLSLLRFAFRHQGAFRDECGRQIRNMGAYAVPGLLRVKTLNDPQIYKMIRYASYQLDRLDCSRPDRAVKQPDPNLLAEILHSYGEIRESAAVDAVLALTNDVNEKVRRSARWAFLQFISGKPPSVIKRKFKLPGGRETEEEKATRLTYRQLAYYAIIQRLKDLGLTDDLSAKALRHAPNVNDDWVEKVDPRLLTEKLFAYYDQKHGGTKQDVFNSIMLFSKEKKKRQEMLNKFDQLLAQDPFHPKRTLMATFYFQHGKELVTQGHYKEAALQFIKAIHLAPQSPFEAEAKARCILAEVLAERRFDTKSESKLKVALALSPKFEQAHLLLNNYQRLQQHRLWIAAGLGAGVTFAFFIIAWAFFRRRSLQNERVNL